ncbi:MAG: DUF1822 family protein [Moorea sp. SIO3I7]|uniref:DUF1822 family protein n=1 Tax=unclassified Moorena TaxID=2683338 RepID=UPI0013CD74FF|nr:MULTISPECIES: DUF1822 family protein [unclassified Moorena]NEO00380.1 DUF1822 family protein [Moorena sp. SIO3I7]NEO20551.1 DUF1822 family protein [Moorena sp. SIO4A5]NEP20807.1 DUF1822 family protein [Moorena sp. SIO3I6]
MEIIESQRIEGYVAKATVAKLFYYAKILRSEKDATQILSMVMGILKECPFDYTISEKDRLYNLIEVTGFEVAEELVCARVNNLEALVTLNAQQLNSMGFTFPVLPVLSVKQVLERQSLEYCFDKDFDIYELIYELLEPETSVLNPWQTELVQNAINLNNWLGNDFREAEQQNWHPWHEILGTVQPSYRYALRHIKGVHRVKKITWDNRYQMALVLHVARETNNEVDIFLQLYAISDPKYLPENTKMIVLDDSDETFIEAQSQLGDLGIQLRFSADYGDKFSVKIDYGGNFSFTDLFMV